MPSPHNDGPLVAAARRLRAEGLLVVDASLAMRGRRDVDGFVDALNAMIVLDVDAIAIAREAGVMTSTVTRWAQGHNRPNVAMMDAGSAAMRRVISQELEACAPMIRNGSLKAA